jgi:hypothetical protein
VPASTTTLTVANLRRTYSTTPPLAAEELEPLLRRRIHAIICSRTATSAGETSVSGQPGQGERRESAADVRLDGDEMPADADDGDASDVSKTYMAICSTSAEVGDIIG